MRVKRNSSSFVNTMYITTSLHDIKCGPKVWYVYGTMVSILFFI